MLHMMYLRGFALYGRSSSIGGVKSRPAPHIPDLNLSTFHALYKEGTKSRRTSCHVLYLHQLVLTDDTPRSPGIPPLELPLRPGNPCRSHPLERSADLEFHLFFLLVFLAHASRQSPIPHVRTYCCRLLVISRPRLPASDGRRRATRPPAATS